MRNRFALAASILTLVFATGCASSGTSSTAATAAATGPANTITVAIDNNLSGTQAATISIAPAAGSPKRLGTVEAGRKQTFTYSGANGNYTLTFTSNQGGNSGVTRSQVFQVTGNKAVTWHLASNSLVE